MVFVSEGSRFRRLTTQTRPEVINSLLHHLADAVSRFLQTEHVWFKY